MPQTNTRRTLDDIIRFTSSIGENSTFEGNITTSENIVVRGTIIGDCNIDAIIVIEESGKWMGNIIAKNLIINGQITGNITAHNKIELQKSAKVIGNLNCPKIAIESGAIHEGSIHMDDKTDIINFKEKRQK